MYGNVISTPLLQKKHSTEVSAVFCLSQMPETGT